MTSPVLDLTDDTFDDFTASGLALVDFTGDGCPPCHAVAPIVERLAADLDGRVRVARIDVDRHPDAADRFGILGLPSFVLFRDGEAVATLLGAHPRRAFDEFLAPHLDG